MQLFTGYKRVIPITTLLLLATFGCMGRGYYLAKYDAEIKTAGKAIANAANGLQRADAYADRGRAYSEKARYSRAFKLIPKEEYERLFSLAAQDHDAAIALAPGDADLYLKRGQTRYDRAAFMDADASDKKFMDLALADFNAALDRAPSNLEALDMRGLVYLEKADYDRALNDFIRERTLDARGGSLRLADAYCRRASQRQRKKNYGGAISDYEQVLRQGQQNGGCDCDVYAALAWIYYEQKNYDKSWEVVRDAKKAQKWIPADLLADLKKASGRDK